MMLVMTLPGGQYSHTTHGTTDEQKIVMEKRIFNGEDKLPG